MKTLSICAAKGGVGKTTLVACIAVAAVEDGLTVGLIDLDPQGSAARWFELRKDYGGGVERMHAVHLKEGGDLGDAMAELAEVGCDLLIVDTPPALMLHVARAIEVADFVLVPVQPSPVDLEAIGPVMQYVREYRRDFAFVLNRAERDTLTEGSKAFLKVDGEVLETIIGNRKAFRAAMTDGKTGAEIERGKAREEIAALWAEVKRRLKLKIRKAA
jgi:chromosome partitioning protein